MKLPSTVFVLHCPKLNPERRVFLEKHLEERVPIKNVRWVEDFTHEHPFVEWLLHTHKLPYGPKITSGMVRHFEIFRTMVEEDIESSLILNDDVMFHRDWVSIFESIQVHPDTLFINLGTALYLDVKPEIGKVYHIHNNGGCEGIYVTKKFAELFLTNINMNHTIDIIFHGLLTSVNHPVLCVPICYQTSIIEKNTSLDHETRKEGNWIEFVKKYSSLPKENYFDILKEFEKYKKIKERKESQIFEIYGKKVNLRCVDYVIGCTNSIIT